MKPTRLSPELRRAVAATRRLEQAMQARDDAIRAAHGPHSYREIADAVGLSHPRVQQIVNAGR